MASKLEAIQADVRLIFEAGVCLRDLKDVRIPRGTFKDRLENLQFKLGFYSPENIESYACVLEGYGLQDQADQLLEIYENFKRIAKRYEEIPVVSSGPVGRMKRV
jgi:hypothetical protein